MMLDAFQAEFVESPRDRMLYDLAMRYNAEAEAFDRTVCSGPILDGVIMPATNDEFAKVNRNAKELFQRLLTEAEPHGITRAELLREIGRRA